MDYLHDLSVFLPGVIVGVAGLTAVLIDAYKNDHEGIFGLTAISLVAAPVAAVWALLGLTLGARQDERAAGAPLPAEATGATP